MTQLTNKDRARFWSKVNRGDANECWTWSGSIGTWGYGSFWLCGSNHNASRIAYIIARGPIGPGLSVLHRCDNPPCCNPSHLFLGTQGDNVRDCREKGRSRGLFISGASHNRHTRKLTDDQIIEARRLHANGIGPSELSRRFGVHNSSMSRIVNRKTFKHLQDE